MAVNVLTGISQISTCDIRHTDVWLQLYNNLFKLSNNASWICLLCAAGTCSCFLFAVIKVVYRKITSIMMCKIIQEIINIFLQRQLTNSTRKLEEDQMFRKGTDKQNSSATGVIRDVADPHRV